MATFFSLTLTHKYGAGAPHHWKEPTMILAIAELALMAGVGTYVWKKLIKRWAETGKRW